MSVLSNIEKFSFVKYSEKMQFELTYISPKKHISFFSRMS
jgi:hypothetical protein